MFGRLRSFGTAREGTSAIEFALVVPVLLVFMGGIVEMGRAYQTYVSVNRLATQYATAWADCSDVVVGTTCGTELLLYTTAAAEQNIAPQLQPVSGISLRMMQQTVSPTGVRTTDYAYPVGATPTAAELAIAGNAFTSGQTGVIVTASYTYTPMFFAAIMKPIIGSSKVFSYTVAQLKS